MEHRSFLRLLAKLFSRLQRQQGVDAEAINPREPLLVVGEDRAFSTALLVVVQGADPPRRLAEMHSDGAFHRGRGSFLGRTRVGSCSASSRSPWSSRAASASSANGVPNPSV